MIRYAAVAMRWRMLMFARYMLRRVIMLAMAVATSFFDDYIRCLHDYYFSLFLFCLR